MIARGIRSACVGFMLLTFGLIAIAHWPATVVLAGLVAATLIVAVVVTAIRQAATARRDRPPPPDHDAAARAVFAPAASDRLIAPTARRPPRRGWRAADFDDLRRPLR